MSRRPAVAPRKFLEEEGLLKRVFTQNIDGLDYQTGRELEVKKVKTVVGTLW